MPTPTNIRIPLFLAVKANGDVRVTKTKPRLAVDEVSVGITLEIPRSAFEKPSFTATIQVAPGAKAPDVTPQIVSAAKNAIETSTGFTVVMGAAPVKRATAPKRRTK